MNRAALYISFTVPIIFLACESRAPGKVVQPVQEQVMQESKTYGAQAVAIDKGKSAVRWKGTKLNYTGKHEGTVAVKEGMLLLREGKLAGGVVVINMQSIKVTDIPPHETIPIRNITNHLATDFSTGTYPTAEFNITDVSYYSGDSLTIRGNMRIKDIVKHVSILSRQSGRDKEDYHFLANFTINRFDWGIGAAGSWLEKKVVDKEIELQIELTATRNSR